MICLRLLCLFLFCGILKCVQALNNNIPFESLAPGLAVYESGLACLPRRLGMVNAGWLCSTRSEIASFFKAVPPNYLFTWVACCLWSVPLDRFIKNVSFSKYLSFFKNISRGSNSTLGLVFQGTINNFEILFWMWIILNNIILHI